MSSPTEASAPSKERTGVGRMLTRVKTIMKKAEKRLSMSGTSKPAAVTKPAPAEPAAIVHVADQPLEVDAPADAGLATTFPDATRVPRMQLHEERARRLGERFGIEIAPSEWHTTEGDALRVNKPIRMRVRRTCHECNTNLGTAKQCPQCQHVRCKQCPRYPAKRTEAEKQAARERRTQVLKEQAVRTPVLVDWEAPKSAYLLTLPAKKGGQDLVFKKPRQRLRRTCCQCHGLFVSTNKVCGHCSHHRCTDCPRDPAKTSKYPYGYPGDEFGANSVPRYQCHLCKTKYPDEAPEGAACTHCAHPRCDSCPRLKPQRVDPEPDPEILKMIEAKLATLTVEQ